MNLNYTTPNVHGILASEKLLDEASPASKGCTMVLHNNVLYCLYLSGDEIRLSSKRSGSSWEVGVPPTGMKSEHLPGLVSFNGHLVIVYRNVANGFSVCKYDEQSKTFTQLWTLTSLYAQTPTFAVLNGVLHMYYRVDKSKNIYSHFTTDLTDWERGAIIKRNGSVTALAINNPVATTYQNMIHLFYQDLETERVHLVRSDGTQWTGSALFLDKKYAHSPGLAVHNGLLNLVFCGLTGSLEQYRYDGCAVSPLTSSIKLDCGPGVPGLAAQDGELVAVFPGAVTSSSSTSS